MTRRIQNSERAVEAKSDFILTGDKDILRPGRFGYARVVMVEEFLRQWWGRRARSDKVDLLPLIIVHDKAPIEIVSSKPPREERKLILTRDHRCKYGSRFWLSRCGILKALDISRT